MLKIFGFIISFFLIGIIFLYTSQETVGLSGSPRSAQRFLNILTAFGILIYVGIAFQLNQANT